MASKELVKQYVAAGGTEYVFELPDEVVRQKLEALILDKAPLPEKAAASLPLLMPTDTGPVS